MRRAHLEQRFHETVDAQFRAGLRWAAFLLAGFFLAITLHRLLVLPAGSSRGLLAAESALLTLAYGLTALLLPRARPGTPATEDAAVFMALGALANAAFLMVLLPQPIQTTNFILVQVGAALAIRSTRRLVLVQILALAGWVALFQRLPNPSAPDHWGFALASGLLLAAAFHLFMRATLARMKALALETGLLLRQRGRLIRDLRLSLDRVKTLRGLIPICAYCKKVRDDEGYWHAVEHYLAQETEARFTHGICPACRAEAKEGWER